MLPATDPIRRCAAKLLTHVYPLIDDPDWTFEKSQLYRRLSR
jgi:hypothetical protein